MKNLLKYTIVFMVIPFLFSSCENDLDINTNPNTPTTVNKNTVFSAAQASFATALGGFLTNYGGFMAQYHTQSPAASQYLAIDQYNITSDFSNGLWTEVFAGGMNDLDFVIQKSSEEKDNGTYLMAKVLRAYMYQIMTDLYGDIPYTDQLLGGVNLSPEIVSQKEIYNSLITSINQALDFYNKSPTPLFIGDHDILFKGDISKWVQFANTLKLKMYIRLSNTELANPTKVLELISKDNFLLEDVKFDIYVDQNNQRNPFADAQLYELNGVNHTASNSLLSFYTTNNDPRLTKVYKPSIKEGLYLGIDQGSINIHRGKGSEDFARPNVSAIKPVYFMTVSESNFLQAEALIKYKNGVGAQTKYEEGLRASFLTYGLNTADAEGLILGAYTFKTNVSNDEKIRQVMVQKWASLAYVNNIEAYFEQLRTGYPEFVSDVHTIDYKKGNLLISRISVLPAETTPQNIWYPDVEVSRNKNMKQKDHLRIPVWWNK